MVASESLVKMYGYDFARMMTKNFERITSEDIDAICHACCHYDLRKLTDEEQRKLHLDFGGKDFDWRYSKKTIPTYMPKAEVTIRPGYAHCGYMAAEPEKYVEQIEQFIRGAKVEFAFPTGIKGRRTNDEFDTLYGENRRFLRIVFTDRRKQECCSHHFGGRIP